MYYSYNYDFFGCGWVVIRHKQLRSCDAFLANRLRCIIQYDALCKCRIKALVPLCVYRRHYLPSRRRRQHDTFLPWFVPRTEPPVQLREVGPDRGHLLTESCSDVHLHVCRYRTGDKDCCCCCSVASRRQNIAACTGVIFPRLDRGCCSSVYCSSTGCCSSTRRW